MTKEEFLSLACRLGGVKITSDWHPNLPGRVNFYLHTERPDEDEGTQHGVRSGAWGGGDGYPAPGGGGELMASHPAAFPPPIIDVLARLLNEHCPGGKYVLDPFIGIGRG